MPYAIIRAGGHQEKVTPGEQITVDRLKQEVGESVNFTPLAISKAEGDLVSDKASLAEAAVVGTVLQHLKGDKVDIFNYRHKTGYRKHTGHRQPLTLVEIAEIRVGGESFKAPEKPAEPEPAATDGEAAPVAKKPAAKKSSAKSSKKSTAKKSTAKSAKK